MSNIAMILERHDLGTLYAQLAYVRILEEGRTEPIDASVGGDVASYLQRFHQAVLVDAPSFMEEWDRRRIQAKGEFEEMRKLENTAFGVSPCEDCGELPCRCGWVHGPAKVVQIEQLQHNLTQFFQATGQWITKEALCGRIPELEIHIKIQGR